MDALLEVMELQAEGSPHWLLLTHFMQKELKSVMSRIANRA